MPFCMIGLSWHLDAFVFNVLLLPRRVDRWWPPSERVVVSFFVIFGWFAVRPSVTTAPLVLG